MGYIPVVASIKLAFPCGTFCSASWGQIRQAWVLGTCLIVSSFSAGLAVFYMGGGVSEMIICFTYPVQ